MLVFLITGLLVVNDSKKYFSDSISYTLMDSLVVTLDNFKGNAKDIYPSYAFENQ